MSADDSRPGKADWATGNDDKLIDDPLLGSLVAITYLIGQPRSADSLRAGLPLHDNRIAPRTLLRAASRAGLSAKMTRRPLSRISDIVLPAILLLQGQDACVLMKVDHREGKAVILLPDTGVGEREIGLDELAEQYTGVAIFIRPEHRFDERAPAPIETGRLNWFWGAIRKSWRIYRDVLIASFLINIFALASPLFIMNVYDRVVPNNAVDTLWVLAIGVITVYSFDVAIRAMRGYFIDLAGKRADIHLSSMLFEKVLGIRMEARPESVGAFANNLSEFESVRNFITSATVTTLIDLPFVALFIAIIALVGGKLALVPLAGIPLILIYGLFVQLPLRHAVEESIRASAEKQATLIESLVGLEAIKAQGAEGAMQRKWEDAVSYIATWSVKARLLSTSVVNVAVFIQQLTTVGVVAYGVYLIGEGELSLGGLIASVILAGRALAPMAQVANIATHYHQAKAALHTLDRLMNLPTERQELHDFVHRSGYFGRIEFDNVSFQYPGQTIPSLKDVTLTIEPGERVALLGPVGSGKSTMEKLIMGLYAPSEGAVRIDGIDVRQLDPAELRRSIGYVPQDISLFYGSVKDNIVFGAPYVSDETMLKAAKLAGVTAMVDPHPLGFDMPVGERGERLSGGQRQSIGLARAVLLNSPIMLLDEPTNSMDGTTEKLIKSRLGTYLNGRTTILVTHRPSLLELVDRIIVLDHGHLVLDGPKQEVLNKLSGHHQLHEAEQTGQGGADG